MKTSLRENFTSAPDDDAIYRAAYDAAIEWASGAPVPLIELRISTCYPMQGGDKSHVGSCNAATEAAAIIDACSDVLLAFMVDVTATG